MRTIINLLLIIVIAIVSYNYFFGDQSEKTESREIVNQVKDLGRSIGDLMKNEKEKLDEGKYDGIFDRMRTVMDKIQSQLESTDTSGQDQLNDMESELNELENDLRNSADSSHSEESLEEWQAKLGQLLERAERMLDSTASTVVK